MSEMIECIGLSQDDFSVVRKYRTVILGTLPDLIDALYDHLMRTGHGGFLENVEVEHLKSRQLEHWRSLFEAEIDDVHTAHMTRIGIIHRDRGVTPKVYVQSYGWFTGRLLDGIGKRTDVDPSERADLAAAVLKFLFLDMTMALASYDVALID